ncbi:MAG: hypothetical protein ACHQX0_07520 [Desulfobaccales bacterium]
MVLVEMVFTGKGGLGQLVDETAAGVEETLNSHGCVWDLAYPLTLRETLRLGLQQQIVGAHTCPPTAAGVQAYRVWLQLPDGGLRAWTTLLANRFLAGCREQDQPEGSPLRVDLQRSLVRTLGSCLERPEIPPVLSGSAT